MRFYLKQTPCGERIRRSIIMTDNIEAEPYYAGATELPEREARRLIAESGERYHFESGTVIPLIAIDNPERVEI